MSFDFWRKPLEANQRSHNGYRYTTPHPHVYPFQWLWDSCFHAIVYRWFDVEMAQDELRALFAYQIQEGDDRGMVPHMGFIDTATHQHETQQALWGNPYHSTITQPPLIAVATLLVYEKSQDKSFLNELFPKIVAYHDWFDRRRDIDQDHLVTLIHPWESGWDASPQWDIPMGINHPTPDDRKRYMNILKTYHHNVELLTANGYFSVESASYNAIRVADLDALAQIAHILGVDATPYLIKADHIRNAIYAKMIRDHVIYDLSGKDEVRLPVHTADMFILLFGGCVDEGFVQTLISRLVSPQFWATYPVSTTALDATNFDPNIYWRGNVWLPINWLIYKGLQRYHFEEIAHDLAVRSHALVKQTGLYEFFNPITGEAGKGAPTPQSWSTIVLDMS